MKIISLGKKLEIKKLFKEGKRVFKEYLSVVYLFCDHNTDNTPCIKIAYVVSKKISNKAVLRNKIKRRLRSAVRQVLKENKGKFNEPKHSILIAIIVISSKIIEVSYPQIYLEIKESFEKFTRYL